jgi:peptide subunit release factor 1 (eRF1)
MIEDRALRDSLVATLDRLARFESAKNLPVLSLYLDARPDSRGRDHYQPFVRKELAARQRTYRLRSPERKSFDRDMEKIQNYLEKSVLPATNGIAIFACAGEGDFEPLQLPVSFDENHFSVGSRPQLFPLARLIDENPRYAVVLADTHTAQILVFAHGFRVDEKELESDVLPRTHGSGPSQMHYQRHVDNMQKHHARELVERLERVVEEDRVEHIVLVGNDVVLPLIRSELSKRLADKVVDELPFDKKKPVKEILDEAQERLRRRDAQTDAERVQRLFDEYRGGGLAVVGGEDVRRALEWGQADELLISATFDRGGPSADEAAGDLVALARRTDTRVTFIEDSHLLEPVGGVGALLRYRLTPPVTAAA